MSPKNKIRITLFIAVLFTLLIKIYLPTKKSNNQIVRDFWIEKTHKKSKKNIVVGGNSRIYRGISIDALQEVLTKDLSGVNLAYSALGYTDKYLDFLHSRIDINSDYKILILGIDPSPLTEIAAENNSFNSYLNVKELEVLRTLYINPYFSISAYKPLEIYKKLKGDFNNDGFIEVKNNYFGNYHSDGWVASYKIPSNPSEALPIYKKFTADNNVKMSEEILERLLTKLKSFHQEGISIIAFRPPSTRKMQNWENQEFGFYEDSIKLKIEQIGGYWINVDTDSYESYDGAHLHYSSAEKLSKLLGQKINDLILSK